MRGSVEDSRPWALVPVKRFSEAKQRLATALTPGERAELARAMLHDVLAVLSRATTLAGVLVVTPDTQAAALAHGYGAIVRDDPLEQGTTAAVRQGLEVLQEQGRPGVLVVPGDVPFLTSLEIREVVDTLHRAPLVLVPATRDGGTNLLAGTLPLSIAPAFGTGSFARHLAAARSQGIEPVLMCLKGLGHDVDTPADLVRPPSRAIRTCAALDRISRPAPAPCSGRSLPTEEPLTT